MKPATLGCFPSAKQASEYLDDERKEEVISKARSEESRQYLWIHWLNWQILIQIKSRSDRIVSEVYLLGQPFAYFFIRLGFHTFSPLAFFMLQKNVSGKIEIHLIIKNTGQPALKVLYFLFSIPKRGLFNMEKELDPLHSEKVILWMIKQIIEILSKSVISSLSFCSPNASISRAREVRDAYLVNNVSKRVGAVRSPV